MGPKAPDITFGTGVLCRYAAATTMKTSASLSPAPNLNVVGVQWEITFGRSQWTAGGLPAVQDAARNPNRVTAFTRERFWICPLRERRLSSTPVWRAGGAETSGAIGASLPNAFRVLRRRSPKLAADSQLRWPFKKSEAGFSPQNGGIQTQALISGSAT